MPGLDGQKEDRWREEEEEEEEEEVEDKEDKVEKVVSRQAGRQLLYLCYLIRILPLAKHQTVKYLDNNNRQIIIIIMAADIIIFSNLGTLRLLSLLDHSNGDGDNL